MNINTTEVNVENNNVEINNVENNNVDVNDQSVDESFTAKQVGSLITNLIKQREDWEANAYRVSNEILYSILAECYALELEISNTKEGVKKLRDEVNSQAKRLGYTFKDGTPLLNRIVRTVFGNVHRSRISTYSLVLREAKNMSVAIADIPSFISKAGGVQEIRLSKSVTYKSPKAKAATAQERFEHMDKLAVVKTEALSKLANPDNIGEYCVLLAKQYADGSFQVKAVVTSTTAVNAALAAVYQAEKAVIDQEEKELKKANMAQSQDEAFKIAA
jgi:hypothetical protein